MRKADLTDSEVELEIARLNASEEVRLAKLEIRIKYKRRQHMYGLRWLEKRGAELMAQGIDAENIEERLFGEVVEDESGRS